MRQEDLTMLGLVEIPIEDDLEINGGIGTVIGVPFGLMKATRDFVEGLFSGMRKGYQDAEEFSNSIILA